MSQLPKKCRICGKEKEVSAFPADERYKGGYRHQCYECVARKANKSYHKNKTVWYTSQIGGYILEFYDTGLLAYDSKEMLRKNGIQYCSSCRKIHKISEFSSARARICMYCVAAKKCTRLLAFRTTFYKYDKKIKTEKQKHFLRAREMKKGKHVVTGYQVYKIAKRQGFTCSCGKPLLSEVQLAVDDNIFTGKDARSFGRVICKECIKND